VKTDRANERDIFMAELNALLTLRFEHENIVDPPVLVMKFYYQGSLSTKLYDSKLITKFPFERRVKYCVDLAAGVDFLHKQGIIHRDIAARNLLLWDDLDGVCITDFGMARQEDHRIVGAQKNTDRLYSI